MPHVVVQMLADYRRYLAPDEFVTHVARERYTMKLADAEKAIDAGAAQLAYVPEQTGLDSEHLEVLTEALHARRTMYVESELEKERERAAAAALEASENN